MFLRAEDALLAFHVGDGEIWFPWIRPFTWVVRGSGHAVAAAVFVVVSTGAPGA